MALMALLSISSNAKPAAGDTPRVVSLSYHQTSSNAWPDLWYDFRREDDGTYTLTNCSRRSKREALRAVVPAEVADTLAQIAKEEKMDKYKSYYAPPFQVYDGWQWELHISFDNKTSLSSSGHMARPDGDGLDRLENYLKEVWSQVDESQAEVVDVW